MAFSLPIIFLTKFEYNNHILLMLFKKTRIYFFKEKILEFILYLLYHWCHWKI